MEQLKITILTDNTAGRFCLAEHGLSFFVETPNKYIFDTGFSDIFIKNAKRLSIDLDSADTVVISHGHDDHTGGLRFLKGKTIVAHPDIFMKRFRKKNKTPLGILFSKEEAISKYNFKLNLTGLPLQLDEQTWFLGEIPRLTSFEAGETAFVDEFGNNDFIGDDSGMAVVTPKGLVIISGCAHSGICNMILHAQELTGILKVHAVIGGFHLVNNDDRTRKTIDFFKQAGVERVMPSHCTMLPALTAFYNEFGFAQVKSGNVIVF